MPAARRAALAAALGSLACSGVAQARCPVRLLENVTTEDGSPDGLRLVDDGLALLAGLRSPVFMVPVIGVYRGGKSLLLNRLQGLTSPYAGGFGVGHGQDTYTRGIDVCPEEIDGLGTVVWMDTEGLFSREDARGAFGPKIFSLALLFSSAVMLNSVKVLNSQFFEFFDQQQQLARVLRRGLEEEGLPVDALLPANLSVVWLLSQPVESGGGATPEQLEAFLTVPGDEARACVRRDFRHQLHEVPRATDSSRLWSRLHEVPDADLSPEYVAACRSLREKVLLELRDSRPLTASGVVAQLRMYVELVQTERFSGALAKEAFEEAELSSLCERYGQTAEALAGQLPVQGLDDAFEGARKDMEPRRATVMEAFHLGKKWSQQLEACFRSRRGELERLNSELVMAQWKANASSIAEEGDCFFLHRLMRLLGDYEAAYAEGLGLDFREQATEHGTALQRARLVQCVQLGHFLWPLAPWVAGPITSAYLRAGIVSGIVQMVFHIVIFAGLYGVLQFLQQLPPYLDVTYPLLRKHPALLEVVMRAPPVIPWITAAHYIGVIGSVWSAWKVLQAVMSILKPRGVVVTGDMAIRQSTNLELKINCQLKRAEAAFKHQVVVAALSAARHLEEGSARSAARALLQGLSLVCEVSASDQDLDALFPRGLRGRAEEVVDALDIQRVPSESHGHALEQLESEGHALVGLVARVRCPDGWETLVGEMVEMLAWLGAPEPEGSGDGFSSHETATATPLRTPQRTPSPARRLRRSLGGASDAETPGSMFASSRKSLPSGSLREAVGESPPGPRHGEGPADSPGRFETPGAWSERPSDAAGGSPPPPSDAAGRSPPPPEERSVVFQPGGIGVEGDFRHGVVENVLEGGQAARQGVEPGWVMCSVDGEPYAEQLIDEKIAGSEPFAVTFQVPDRLDEEGTTDHDRARLQVSAVVGVILGVVLVPGLLAWFGSAGLLPGMTQRPRGAGEL